MLLGALLTISAPASALPQRGHSFAFSFASKGSAAARLLHPAGIAINEASGDVYVVDAANNRIERFSASGEFIAAWGWGVSDAKAEYELCTSSCKAGLAGEGEAQLDAPQAIALDNSTSASDPSRGDLYVLANTAAQNNVVEKFSAAGTPLGRLHFKEEAIGAIGGLALDASGRLWVSALGSGEILSFDDAQANEQQPSAIKSELECAETPGFALDASAEALYLSHQSQSATEECPEVPASAKAPALIAMLDSSGKVLSEALGQQNTSALAVDQASSQSSPLGQVAKGDVYLDNQTSIAAYSSTGAFIQRFGTAEELLGGAGVAIDSQTGAIYVADSKGNKVDVFQAEAPGPPSIDSVSFQNLSPSSTELKAQLDPHGADTHFYFQYGSADCRATPAACTSVPLPPGEDIGAGFGAQGVSVLIDHLQPGTTYFYRVLASNENGEAEGAQTLSSFTTLPSSLETLPDGRSWELVSPPEKHGALIYPIGGSTESSAPGLGAIQASEDGSQITYAANAPIGEGVSGNRSLEATQAISSRGSEAWSTQDIVTPHEHAEGIVPTNLPQEYRAFSSDLSLALVQPFGGFGNRFQEPALVPGNESEERGIYLRHDASCPSAPASCYEPLLSAADVSSGAQFGGKLELDAASTDLRHAVFSSDVALSSASPSAPGLYEWSAQKPASEALQLISVLPGNKKAVSEPEPQLGDLDPGISTARNAISADGSRVFWSAIVEGPSSSPTRLFMRDTRKGQTLQLNAAQGVKEPHGEEAEKEEVHFRSTSADGSKVFFSDNFPLTAQSRLQGREGGPQDLYVCEISEGAEGPECKLTDLTVNARAESGEAADVIGTVLGASSDGTYLYFMANGVLSEEAAAQGAHPGSCARPSAQANASASASCNLYLEHYDAEANKWEAPRFIASLSQEDSPDWGSSGGLSLGSLTSRVSPSGRYLAFMSRESLSGYDNRDASAQADEARDEEVFLYDAQTGRLVCASCDPSGARPHGILDREKTGEGKGLLVDRFGIWQETAAEENKEQAPRALDHWLGGSIPGWTPLDAYQALYQSRYLTDDGRLFFDSPGALVPHDSNGREDVYQYEPAGVGSCEGSPGCVALISSGQADHESAFLDASASGNDAFILTNRQLVAADHDTNFDVYDAHVCSASSPCLPSPASSAEPCEALETCRPAYSPQAVLSGPSGSATLSGQGNIAGLPSPGSAVKGALTQKKPLSRSQKLALALKACRKRHKGKSRRARANRASCERQVRKKYAPKKHARRANAIAHRSTTESSQA